MSESKPSLPAGEDEMLLLYLGYLLGVLLHPERRRRLLQVVRSNPTTRSYTQRLRDEVDCLLQETEGEQKNGV